jgi:primosomal protein N' (replication factor Y)
MLQTYQPEHPVLRAICAGGRDDFMAQDLAGRSAAGMPPFGQLTAVIVEAEKESVLQKLCADLAASAPKLIASSAGSSPHGTARILGPIPAPVYKVRSWHRMRFLVCGDERAALQPVIKRWLSKVKQPANVRIKIDVNPQNFM